MKKFIYSAMAVAMLATTSCQDDMILPGGAGETATVAFNVSTPEIGTRAYSDGTTATVLQYAVYEKNGDELTYLPNLTVAGENATSINGKTTVKLDLTTGETYAVIFWAAAPDAPYTVDFANKKMTVDYNGAVSNDESRDAFYKYETFTVTGADSKTVELKRPFAQLNIGTSDYAQAAKAGYTPTHSAVTVNDVYTVLNLATGDVDENAKTSASFAMADIKKNEKFPVDGYEYLAMNYFLVDDEKETVDVTFFYGKSDDINEAKTRTVGSVPVRRNYRTNIYGKLLTSTVDVNVEIEPDYECDALEAWDGVTVSKPTFDETSNTYYISHAAELAWIAQLANGTLPAQSRANADLYNFAGATIKLEADINLNGKEWTPISMSNDLANGKTFRGTFDGQGHTIYGMTVNQQKVSGLFGYVYAATIKNVTIAKANINSNHFAGGIVAWVLNTIGNIKVPMIIENCNVINSTITSAPEQVNGAWDNGDKAGGLVGYYESNQADKGAVIRSCAVENTTIKAYRDFGGLIGYAKGAAIVNCTTNNVTLEQDLTHDYKAPNTPTTIGEFIGREEGNNTINGATVLSAPAELASGNYVVMNDIKATTGNAITLANNADVTIEIVGTRTITGAANGISVPANAKLTLKGNGNLTVVGLNGSGIGGDGNINIDGLANITAKGIGDHAFGIGGNGANVVIKNSTVDYACGGHIQPLFINDKQYGKSEPEGGAAIGGATIKIINSTVTKADGGSKAAAIGAQYWQSTDIEIANSTIVEANGGNASAGIGGSRYSGDISETNKQSVKIKIANSTVTANGGQAGAGIGSGYDTHCAAKDTNAVNDITITNSTINAKGGKYAAGIGTGFHAAALTGSIDNSTITAVSGENKYKDTYTTAQDIGYGVVDPDREFAGATVTFKVNGSVIEHP